MGSAPKLSTVHDRHPGDSPLARFAARLAEVITPPMPPAIQLGAAPARDADRPAFPFVTQGYDPATVEAYLDRLAGELAEARSELHQLRGPADGRSAIQAEIERLGEQTSAILITAHNTATETIGLAEVQARTQVADSASYAVALREQAELDRRRVEHDIEGLRRERDRLIGEIERTAAALSAVAAHAAHAAHV